MHLAKLIFNKKLLRALWIHVQQSTGTVQIDNCYTEYDYTYSLTQIHSVMYTKSYYHWNPDTIIWKVLNTLQ